MHVLQKVLTSSRLSPRRRKHSLRVGRACALRVEELDARCEIRVRALIQVPDCQTASWPSERRRGPYAKRVRIRFEDLHLADGTLFWVVFADSEKNLRWLRLPWVPRPACAFRDQEPWRRLPIEFGCEVAIIFRDRKQPSTRNHRAAGRGAMEFALRQMYGCPVDRKHFSHFTKSAANAAKYRTARTIAHGVVDATAISLCWFATQTFAHLRAPKTLDNRQQLRACESRPADRLTGQR